MTASMHGRISLKEKARSTLYLRFSPMRFEIGINQNS